MQTPDATAGKSHFWIETWEDATGWRARAMHDDAPVRRCGISGMPTRYEAAIACSEKAQRRYGITIEVFAFPAESYMTPPDTLTADEAT